MSFLLYDEPDSNFTKVSNDLLWNPHISAAHKITMLQLASLCFDGESHKTIRSVADIAKIKSVKEGALRTAVNRAVKAGGITKDMGSLVIEVKGPAKEVVETIQDEIDEAPKRKHKMTQKESWELVKKGWNKDKPEAWLRLDGSMNLPVMIALETHTKRLGIEREKYESFVAQVCRGAQADSWWSKQNMKASSVFGFSKVTDKKFENVEKLYKAGANVESAIDYGCDADILARYHEKGHDQLTKVIRLEAVDRLSAQEHLFGIPEEEYDATAAYIYFTEGSERPIYWSFENRNSTRYLFS